MPQTLSIFVTIHRIVACLFLSYLSHAVIMNKPTNAALPQRAVDITSLQKASNGFDLRGIASHDAASAVAMDGPALTGETAFWVGFGFAKYLQMQSDIQSGATRKDMQVKIGLGMDSRHSGMNLAEWLAGGIQQAGGVPYNMGLCTTPAAYLSCIAVPKANEPWPLSGAICITASHLPSAWNGFKLFTPTTPFNIGSEGIKRVIDIVSSDNFDDIIPSPVSGSEKTKSFHAHPILPTYSAFLKSVVCRLTATGESSLPLKGLTICVNAGNGAGGFLADTLSELGADTSSSINLQPDGTFPAHVANPEDPAAIAATRKAVLATGADVGICLDTDADRVGLVEKSGRLLNRNGLVALVSKIALKEYEQKCIGEEGSDMKKGVVVTDSATSTGLTDYVQNVLNGDHVRYKKGYRYVIEHAKSIPNSLVAVECSGHSAWADNNWVDDGSYTAVKLIAELCNMRRELKSYELANMVSYSRSHMLTFSDLLEGLIEPAESVELRMRMAGGKAVIEAMTAKSVEEFGSVVGASPGWKVEPVNYEGLRANFEIIDENYVADSCNGVASNEENTNILTGWTMIRVSLHEPIVSLQIESNQVGGVMHAARCLLGSEGSGIGLHTLEGELDLSPLLKAANISSTS